MNGRNRKKRMNWLKRLSRSEIHTGSRAPEKRQSTILLRAASPASTKPVSPERSCFWFLPEEGFMLRPALSLDPPSTEN